MQPKPTLNEDMHIGRKLFGKSEVSTIVSKYSVQIILRQMYINKSLSPDYRLQVTFNQLSWWPEATRQVLQVFFWHSVVRHPALRCWSENWNNLVQQDGVMRFLKLKLSIYLTEGQTGGPCQSGGLCQLSWSCQVGRSCQFAWSCQTGGPCQVEGSCQFGGSWQTWGSCQAGGVPTNGCFPLPRFPLLLLPHSLTGKRWT